MGEFLLVTIQVDMHDRLALTLQDDLTEMIVKNRAHGVLIDISALEVVDSFIGRMLGNIASVSRVLDAATVVVGMRSEEHTSELQSRGHLVCRLLLEKKKKPYVRIAH